MIMPKRTLQELMFLAIDLMDEDSEKYERFCGIALPLLGVTGPDGSLSPAYADSPMWKLKGDVLMPSAYADLASMMLKGTDAASIAKVLASLGLDPSKAEALHEVFGNMAQGQRDTVAGHGDTMHTGKAGS